MFLASCCRIVIFFASLNAAGSNEAKAQMNTSRSNEDVDTFLNIRIDASPFLKEIKNALMVQSPNCSIPADAIMFTCLNNRMFDLVLLQRKAMEIGNVRKCLESRFITICLDRKCVELCHNNSIPHCIRINLPRIQPSDFGGKSYSYITWIKQEFMYEATKVAQQIFFFDADVIILRNPWLEISYGRDEKTGQRISGPYDIQYQRERGIRERGCGGSVNTGQMYIRNSSAIQSYFHKLFEKKYDIIVTRKRLEQEFVGDLVSMLKYCTLPSKYFFGHCIYSRDYGAVLSEIIAYHTSCVSGLARKKTLLLSFIDHVSNKRFTYVRDMLSV